MRPCCRRRAMRIRVPGTTRFAVRRCCAAVAASASLAIRLRAGPGLRTFSTLSESVSATWFSFSSAACCVERIALSAVCFAVSIRTSARSAALERGLLMAYSVALKAESAYASGEMSHIGADRREVSAAPAPRCRIRPTDANSSRRSSQGVIRRARRRRSPALRPRCAASARRRGNSPRRSCRCPLCPMGARRTSREP